MNIPEYISVKEVKKICENLGIRDWTLLRKSDVDLIKNNL